MVVRLLLAEAEQLQSRIMAKVILKNLKKVYPNTEKKKKAKKGEEVKKTSGIVVSAIMSCLLFVGALMPSFMFADYDGLPTTGEYEVAMTKAIIVDESRPELYEKQVYGPRR